MPVALLLALLLLALPGAAFAQDAPPVDGGMVTLDFQDTEITEVIGAIAKATGKNFLYDDRVRGRVTVISETPVTADEAYRVFESILQVKGFTTVPSPGGVLKIVPLRDAKENPLDTVTGDKPLENRDLFITRLIPLRFVKAEQISETIKPLVSKEASVISYAPTNTLIITDSAANIRRLVNIIDQIDVSTYQEQIKLIPIRYADAAALTGQLAEIFGGEAGSSATPGAGGGRIRRARAAAQAQQPQQGIPGVETVIGGGGEPRFIPDERTNAIIVIANKAVLREVERIIELLDYQRKGAGRIHVYRLQNADAEEIAQTLAGLAGGGGGGARPATTRTNLSGVAGGAGQAAGASLGGSLGGGAVADLGDGVRITADTPTNSLIIQASAEAFSTLAEVIEALDIRRPQVMVEALIMEVDVNDSQSLGASWIYRTEVGSDGVMGIGSATGAASPSVQSLLGSLVSAAAAGPNFATALIGGSIEIPNPDPNAPAGSTITVPTISAIITASESDDNVNIISAPTILTADNEEAEIVVGQNIPVPTSNLQATTTVTQPGVSPFQTSQNIAREDVGVTLRVTPQISEGDTVRLNIFQEISEVNEAASRGSTIGPTTTNRKVENVVYVRDGEAVMIGGILAEVQGTGESKVPWLGDVPILGWAFKGSSDTLRKTNLLVILTPRIVRSPEDLERVTVEGRERFRDASKDQMMLSEDEEEERRAALEAGIPLPRDPNPVRREVERHDERYPIEQLPELRERVQTGEQQRLDEMEALKAQEAGGSYLVQVAHFAQAESAVSLLQKLMGDGYDGTVLTRSEQGATTHWVQLGPFTTEAKAQAVARDVNATLGFSSLVIVEP